MGVSAEEVRELRAKTGAGVMECKKALETSQGNMAAAEAALKERGLSIAKEREERTTNQGRIFGLFSPDAVSLVELRCETDFVAENAEFIRLGERSAREVHDQRLSEPNERIRQMVVDSIALIRENIVVNSIHTLVAGENDCVTGYVHDGGRIASILRLSLSRPGLCSEEAVRTLASDLALHITAFAPQFIREQEIDREYRDALETEFRRELADSGKPSSLFDRIISGKWRKHLEQVCLADQPFIRNEEISVSTAIEGAEGTIGASIRISEFAYVAIAPAVCL